MMTDPIADMLTRIRNAASVHKPEVFIPYSNLKFSVAKVLEQEGYVRSVEKIHSRAGRFDEIAVKLKYRSDGKGAIQFLKRISTPSRRMYVGYRDISAKDSKGRGIMIVSTPRGIMTAREAQAQKVGGEILCEIY